MIEVSVVMAVYNTPNRNVIELAINSILMQTYTEIELLICDDGSTDGTYDYLEEISKRDTRITLLKNNINMGASIARNKCIAVAKGEFIAIMDADDYSHHERLEKQLQFLRDNSKYAFVGVKGKYFNDINENNLGVYWFCEYPQREDFLFTLPFVHGSIMFRKRILFSTNGYREENKVRRSEDYDLLMNLYADGHYGANLQEILYFIRLDENTYKRRKYRYRINESMVKYRGFKNLGLMPNGFFYALKPLILGLIPLKLLNAMKRKHDYSK